MSHNCLHFAISFFKRNLGLLFTERQHFSMHDKIIQGETFLIGET